MERNWPESVTSNRQRVMEELVQGRKMANQLQSIISGDARSAEGLVSKILGLFTTTLLILNGSQEANKQELISQIQANSPTGTVTGSASGIASGSPGGAADSSSWDALDDAVKSEDSHEENYKSSDRETLKDRRGSYKRRKTSHSWTKDSLELVDDGHAWRKYGQKTILNNKHPRNYFRCTHKFDKGCKATKHVQRIEDKPQLYRTTYYGNHTCKDYLRDPEHILDCSSSQESTKNMIRCGGANNDFCSQQEQYPDFSSFTSIKKENVKEEEIITPISDYDHASQNQSSSSCDHLMSPVLGVFESSGPISGLSSTIAFDLEDDLFSRMMGGYCENEADYLYDF